MKITTEGVIAFATGSILSLVLAMALPALFAAPSVFVLIGCVVYARFYPNKVKSILTKHVGQGQDPEA